MKLEKSDRGVYHASYWTPFGTKTTSTKAHSKEEAQKVVKASKIEQIEQAAKAGALTQSAISQILSGKQVTTSQALHEWTKWLELNSGSRFTVSSYATTLNAWIQDMELSSVMPSMITAKHISDWVNNRRSAAKLSTRRMWLSVIRKFYKFLTGIGYALANPSLLVTIHWQNLSHEQKETKEKEVFSDIEFSRLVVAADNWQIKSHTPGFWGVAIRLSRYLGLRLGDICNLEWAALKFKPGYIQIKVWTRKRNTPVCLPLDEPELQRAIAMIRHDDAQYCYPLERYISNEPKDRHRLSKYFQRLCEMAGIEGKSFHCLRHTYATECARKGKSMPHIAADLGHRHLTTTELYIHTGKE